MSSRIEQIIEEIEEFVESCKYQPLSTTKIVVNKEELEELLRELRLKTPDEIKRYQKIISNKDAILADAQAKADSLIAEAQAKTKEMVSQHEVMQQAYAQANETIANANKQAQQILDEATMDANNIRLSAISYTDDMMANMEQILATAINESGEKYRNYLTSIQSCYDVVRQNRSELAPQVSGAETTETEETAEADASLEGLDEEQEPANQQGTDSMNCFSCNISTNREGSAAEHSPCLCYTRQSTKRGKSQGKKVTEGQVHRRSTNKGDSGSHFRESGEK